MKQIDHSSRQLLIDTALALFKERGYEHVAIKDICEAAGCANSTFYYHFGSMNGLIYAIQQQSEPLTPELLSRLAILSSPWEKLWTFHASSCRRSESYGCSLHFQLLFCGDEKRKALQKELLAKADQFIIPFIRQAQECGEIRNQTSAEILANTVGLTMVGVIYYWYMSDGEIDLESYMKTELQNLYDLRPDLRT